MAVTLRPERDADRGFLLEVYASTRRDEVAAFGWPAAQQDAFLRQQAEVQHAHYRQQYAGDDFLVIEEDGAPIGRLYLGRWADEIRLIDIALLPAHRGRGLGTRLVRDVLDEAGASGRAVRLHVEPANPARRLYERLGFRVVEQRGLQLFMEWRAADGAGAS